MDCYKLEIKKSAEKDIRKLSKVIIKYVTRKIQNLQKNPFPRNFKKLKTAETLYRIRIGDYRVIYEVIANEKLIIVHYVRHRKDVYRNL